MDLGRRQTDLRLGAFCLTAGVLGVCTLSQLPPLSWLAALGYPRTVLALSRAVGDGCARNRVYHLARAILVRSTLAAERYGEERWVQYHVASLPQFSRKDAEDDAAPVSGNWRFLFEIQDDEMPSRMHAVWNCTDQIIKATNVARFKLRLKSPHGFANLGVFDY